MSDSTTQKRTFPYIATIVAFVAIVIMLILGFWQLDRKAQKEERLAQIHLAAQQNTIQLQNVLHAHAEYQDYLIEANGQLMQNSFYIDNKLHDGKAGFNVLQPFKTDAGIVLIDLGWIPSTAPRPSLPSFQPLSFEKVKGILHIPSHNKLIQETNVNFGAFPAMLQQIDLDQMERHLGQRLLPFVLRLPAEPNSEFSREWEAVTMSPEKHLGYAIQWFGLAIAALTVYLLSILKWMQSPNAKNN